MMLAERLPTIPLPSEQVMQHCPELPYANLARNTQADDPCGCAVAEDRELNRRRTEGRGGRPGQP
jgi:hypothetical protein